MSRKLFLVLSLFVLLSSLLYVRFSPLNAKSSNGYPVHNLDTGLNYTSIQEAIDANETDDGHALIVDAGTYWEGQIIIHKSLNIKANGLVTIDGLGQGHVIHITANNVTLDGFTVTNSSLSPVADDEWHYPYSGVFLDNVESCVVENNEVTNNVIGIKLRSSNGNSVVKNNVSSNELDGISIGSSNRNSIRNNYVTNNQIGRLIPIPGLFLYSVGISVVESSENVLEHNTVANNTDRGIWIIYMSKNNSLRYNEITGSKHNFGVYGILWDSSDFIHDIDLTNKVDGKSICYLVNEEKLTINRSFPEIGYVGLVGCNNITVSDLKLMNNGVGISLVNSFQISVVSNEISGAIKGCELITSEQSEIRNNNIFECQGGVCLQRSNHNFICGNTLSNGAPSKRTGTSLGMFLEYSSGNYIYRNNFINNTDHLIAYESNNFWDNGIEGNYWDDYGGVDADFDGIGDTSLGDDNYPLMGMFSDFNATTEHHVQTICNSSISDFRYNGTALLFHVSGFNGTAGFCRMCIPKAFMNDTFRVFVNGTEILPFPKPLPCSNSTHNYIYFDYTHSEQEVVIISEFPSFLILPLFMIATLLATIVYGKKTNKSQEPQEPIEVKD